MIFDSFFGDFGDMFSDFLGGKQAFKKRFQGYSIEKEPGKGIVLVCVTLGIPKENLTVKLEDRKGIPYKVVTVKGSVGDDTKYFDSSVDYEIPIKLIDKIVSISYSVKDGITKIFLKTEEEPKEVINPKLLGDDDSDLDW